MSDDERRSARLDQSVPHSARIYDWLLGGKDNFAVDRDAAARLLEVLPHARDAAQANRGFMTRAVRFAAEQGVRQFLDIGTGLPTSPNVHEVAQAVDPAARVVYVDNDPVVLVHARALLTGSPQGETRYIDADLSDPGGILADPGMSMLDLARPVALSLVAVLHFLTDEHDPYGVVRRLVDALAPGSFLIISHITFDPLPPESRRMMEMVMAQGPKGQQRGRAEVERFFDGLELLAPGVVSVADWRPDDDGSPRPSAQDVACYGAVGRMP